MPPPRSLPCSARPSLGSGHRVCARSSCAAPPPPRRLPESGHRLSPHLLARVSWLPTSLNSRSLIMPHLLWHCGQRDSHKMRKGQGVAGRLHCPTGHVGLGRASRVTPRDALWEPAQTCPGPERKFRDLPSSQAPTVCSALVERGVDGTQSARGRPGGTTGAAGGRHGRRGKMGTSCVSCRGCLPTGLQRAPGSQAAALETA